MGKSAKKQGDCFEHLKGEIMSNFHTHLVTTPNRTSMKTVHALKILPEYFKVVGKEKPFEVRKDDRGFQVGDTLWLQEWNEENGYTGQDRKFTVSYILRGEQWGLMDGYCVLGLAQTTLTRG